MKENPNKKHQANWRKNTSLNFSVGLILSLTLVITAFEWRFRDTLTDRPIHITAEDAFSDVELVVLETPLPDRPKAPNTVPAVDLEPIPVESDKDKKEVKEPDTKPNIDQLSGDLNKLFGSDFFGKEKTDKPEYELISAQPKEGMEAFYQYLYENIRYPAHLSSRNISGKVFVKFEINKVGKIVNVEIIKGFDKSLEEEIIRVLEASPAWEPAQLGMEKVQTQLKIPFTFHIR